MSISLPTIQVMTLQLFINTKYVLKLPTSFLNGDLIEFSESYGGPTSAPSINAVLTGKDYTFKWSTVVPTLRQKMSDMSWSKMQDNPQFVKLPISLIWVQAQSQPNTPRFTGSQ